MSLEIFQDLLVALCADRTARRRFAQTPGGRLPEGLALDERERRALATLPLEMLDRYAESLLAKRWGEVGRVVPLTLRLVPDLGARYRAWAAEHPARASDGVLSPGAAEALRALEPLRAALSRDEGIAPYAADVLAFEVLSAASRGDGTPRTLRARFAVQELVEELRRGTFPLDPPARATDLRFERGALRWRSA